MSTTLFGLNCGADYFFGSSGELVELVAYVVALRAARRLPVNAMRCSAWIGAGLAGALFQGLLALAVGLGVVTGLRMTIWTLALGAVLAGALIEQWRRLKRAAPAPVPASS